MVQKNHNLMNVHAYFIKIEHWNFVVVRIISVSKLKKYSKEKNSTFKG